MLALLVATEVSLDPLRLAGIVLVTMVAGIMNSIAGGGTLLTFPALVWLGVPPIVANATSTVALWPGAVGSMWGYRSQLSGAQRWAIWFAAPSLLGGAAGAALLLSTPPAAFDRIVPWLVLGATALFIVQGPTVRAIKARADAAAARMQTAEIPAATADWRAEARATPSPAATSAADIIAADRALTSTRPRAALLIAQFMIGIYGGYFGAGVGILMLAALGFMGLRNIHRMNGLKNWGGLCMNFVAALAFAFSDLVNWPVALAMAIGATSGGYTGSRMAQRVSQVAVRRAIVAIGLGSGIWLMLRAAA